MTAAGDKRPTVRATTTGLLIPAIIALSLRCYARVFIVKNFGLDDIFMVLAGVLFILFATFTFLCCDHALGLPDAAILEHPADMEMGLKYFFFCYIWYASEMVMSKISICISLLRITVRKLDIWILYGIIVATVLSGLLFVFLAIFQCKPVSGFWDKSTNPECWDPKIFKTYVYVYSSISVLCDFTCAVLPMFLIWSLKMTLRSKIALIPIMLMACVASSGVAVRFAYLDKYGGPDFFFTLSDIVIWSIVEGGLAITAGSLFTLRPLFKIIGQKLGLTRSGHSTLADSENQYPNPKSSSRSRSGNQRRRTDADEEEVYHLNFIVGRKKYDNTGETESTSGLRNPS